MRDRAKAAYREAIRLSPEFAKALNNLGIILASEGDLGEAEEALRRAVAADPRYARAHLNLANLYLKRNSPDQALPHLEAVIRLEPDHPRIEQIRSLASRIRQGR
jgi:tetratricopeptide (TPR) repeat protein